MTFPFLKLPVEIRNRIYKLALTVEEPIKITSRLRQSVHQSTTRSGTSFRARTDEIYGEIIAAHTTALALTASCRQVYLESISIYYSSNVFECVTKRAFSLFLNDIGRPNRRLVSNVHIAASHFRYFRQLTDVKSLSVLVKDFNSAYHLPCCVARSLEQFAGTSRALESVEVRSYTQSNGIRSEQSEKWTRADTPSMAAFLRPLTRLYFYWGCEICTPWGS